MIFSGGIDESYLKSKMRAYLAKTIERPIFEKRLVRVIIGH
jgi:hypothetical protein